MLYLICPSCIKSLGDKQIIIEKVLDKICKDEEIGKITSEQSIDLKQALVNSFELDPICCKPRLMTYKKLIDIVQ